MHYLYRITNQLNSKVYIGQTVDDKARWGAHQSFAKNPEKTGQYIHRAMAKYGVENFIYEVIAACRTQEDADETETTLIKQYDSRNIENGYNIAPGGNQAWNAGLPKEQQPMYGKKQSDYQKQRCSETHKGVSWGTHTEEWKQKASLQRMGHPTSEETIAKISQAQIGKVISKETRAKMAASAKFRPRRKHSSETKAKMSIVAIGRVFSDDHIKNLGLAKRKFTTEHELEICQLRKAGQSVRDLTIQFDCSKSTIRNIIKRNK
jgi:group I intron endonuclease